MDELIQQVKQFRSTNPTLEIAEWYESPENESSAMSAFSFDGENFLLAGGESVAAGELDPLSIAWVMHHDSVNMPTRKRIWLEERGASFRTK